MPRFLVVDDDATTVKALARLLADDGHEVVPFTGGAEAVAALKSEPFDAVLTDLEMPHVDGHAVVGATRECHPHACVVVVSASVDREHDRLVEAGVCIIADKPLAYEEVTEAVRACRAQKGPSLHGGCHMKRKNGDAVVRLRRK